MPIVGVRGPSYNPNETNNKYIPMVSGIETSQFWIDRVAERHCMSCPEWTKQSGSVRSPYIPANYSSHTESELAGYPLHDMGFWSIFQKNTMFVGSGMMMDTGRPFENAAAKLLWSGINYNVRYPYAQSGYTEHESEFLRYGRPNKEDYDQYIPVTHLETPSFEYLGNIAHVRRTRDYFGFYSEFLYSSGSTTSIMPDGYGWKDYTLNGGIMTVSDTGINPMADLSFTQPDCSTYSFADTFAPGKIIGYKTVGCPGSANSSYRLEGLLRHTITKCDIDYHNAYSGIFHGDGNITLDNYQFYTPNGDYKRNTFFFTPRILYSGYVTEDELCRGFYPGHPLTQNRIPSGLVIEGDMTRVIDVYGWPLKTNNRHHAFRSTFGLAPNQKLHYSGVHSDRTQTVGVLPDETIWTSRQVTSQIGSPYRVSFGDVCCQSLPGLTPAASFNRALFDGITRQSGVEKIWYAYCNLNDIVGTWQSGLYKEFANVSVPRANESRVRSNIVGSVNIDCSSVLGNSGIYYQWQNVDSYQQTLNSDFFNMATSGMFSCYNPNKDYLIIYSEKQVCIPPIDEFAPETIVRGSPIGYISEAKFRYFFPHFELATATRLSTPVSQNDCYGNTADGFSTQDIDDYYTPWSNMSFGLGICQSSVLYGAITNDSTFPKSEHFKMPYIWPTLYISENGFFDGYNGIGGQPAYFSNVHFSGISSYLPFIGNSVLELENDYELYNGTLRTHGNEHYAI